MLILEAADRKAVRLIVAVAIHATVTRVEVAVDSRSGTRCRRRPPVAVRRTIVERTIGIAVAGKQARKIKQSLY